ncbi:MAG: Crp/Fnr family transcriptional regulator [Pleurocapsa sp. MO_192.B19]|nr:Crp/Fnr family transcriptional regulator [Pleurocapsa sp. MO_192.B19]
MQFYDHSSEVSGSFLTWQNIIDWAKTHYRDRLFHKDEQIPARPELIYLVNQGAVRLVSKTQNNQYSSSLVESSELDPDKLEDAFLGFVGEGRPFEIVAQSSFSLHAYAHVDNTHIVWLYWEDLENWPDFRQEIYEAFRYEHQRKLLWLSALGQRRTIDRLTSFLSLLIEEYGDNYDGDYCLPYTLTHAQIGSAIGSTRVTVTRLMGKLRRQGIISVQEDNSICMNHLQVLKNDQKP